MIQALWTARAGLVSQQYNVDTIANNIANADTTAFKRNTVHIEDMPYVYKLNPSVKQPRNEGELPHMGTGARVVASPKYFAQGAMQQTERKLDLAIEGPGFFSVTDGMGNAFFTRDGNFKIAEVEENGLVHEYITTQDGYWLLGQNGLRIELPAGTSEDDISVSSNGVISAGGVDVGNLAIVEFTNPQGLQALGNNLYTQTDNAGQAAFAAGQSHVRQGFLESSNVDMADEMTRLIQAQRVYALNAKALQTADEMLGLANSIRR